ncbi:MAG TPA: hypothetical protein VF321_00300 [Gaiellaceae bacterium]
MSEHADAETIDFLTRERAAIVEAALGDVTSRHYDAAGAPEVRRRLEALLDHGLEALATHDLTPIVAHAQQIARERFSAGYDLSEVQSAFNALEAATWARVLATLPPDRFARTLGLVSTILGAGKDALARTYVSLATDAHAPSLDLRALFAGTDSA